MQYTQNIHTHTHTHGEREREKLSYEHEVVSTSHPRATWDMRRYIIAVNVVANIIGKPTSG